MEFNSAEYAWKDLEVTILGRVLVRILEIKYKISQEKKHIYGRGTNPVGVQRGNKKPTGEITIGQSELESLHKKIRETVPGGTLNDVDLDINVAYLSTEGIVRDRVVGCSFTDFEKGMKQGDTDMQVKIPFLFLGLETKS